MVSLEKDIATNIEIAKKKGYIIDYFECGCIVAFKDKDKSEGIKIKLCKKDCEE